ncbi:endonuclease NucS [Halococcus salsus]|uniref:endonuclease NucS n=1 Tax=Halococcus salsus TaxID=2162894 RepID=UPI00135B8EC1|nr:endonuclease NucS [Halococcus salsus]
MMFSVDREAGRLDDVIERSFHDLDVLERYDLQEWVIEKPRILGEELLIVTSEFQNFVHTRERLDVLALDPAGKLVVVELKRDKADETTDLQAIKYASYCATLTAQDVQEEYRKFHRKRTDSPMPPEDVGDRFISFLDEPDEPFTIDEEGWAEFELDDRPRILLAAGEFGREITAPVIWLTREFGMEITCIRVDAYEHQDRVLLNSRQIIPTPEVEEYLTRRQEKERRQSETRRGRTINALLDSGALESGQQVVYNPDQVPKSIDREYDPLNEFWQAEVTGNTGQSNNVRWLHNGKTYSFTGLTKELLNELIDRDRGLALNGYNYWIQPDYDRTLADLRDEPVRAE